MKRIFSRFLVATSLLSFGFAANACSPGFGKPPAIPGRIEIAGYSVRLLTGISTRQAVRILKQIETLIGSTGTYPGTSVLSRDKVELIHTLGRKDDQIEAMFGSESLWCDDGVMRFVGVCEEAGRCQFEYQFTAHFL
ncbi:MAG: hypothetical protein K0U93_00830 [Gammaproteobacteria bacterium]|nr:hypothetical protein [Gammaproteobacteria bacterium]